MTRRRRKSIGPDARDIYAALYGLRGLSRANAEDLALRSIWTVRELIADGGFPFRQFSAERRESLVKDVEPGVLKAALRWRASGSA